MGKPSHPTDKERLNEVVKRAEHHYKQGELEESKRLFRLALHIDPLHSHSWCYLALILHSQRQLEESEAAYRTALQLKPQFSTAWNNLGNCLRDLGKLNEALSCHLRALEIRPDYPVGELNLGISYLTQGKLKEGFPFYISYWKRNSPYFKTGSTKIWDGSSLKGKRLILLSDQGFGDLLFFARYHFALRERGAHLTLVCNPRLFSLLKLSGVADEFADFDALPELSADFYIPMGLLPLKMRTTSVNIPAPLPYLKADPRLVESWKKRLSAYPGFRIGISWCGNPDFPNDALRSIPLSHFASIAALPSVRLISLQKERATEDPGFELIQLELDQGAHRGFMDTAAIIQSLDLIICCDTSLVHLSAALGAPTWLPLCRIPHWAWGLKDSKSAWYPEVLTLFRQNTWGNWEGVFEQMTQKLHQQLSPSLTGADFSTDEWQKIAPVMESMDIKIKFM